MASRHFHGFALRGENYPSHEVLRILLPSTPSSAAIPSRDGSSTFSGFFVLFLEYPSSTASGDGTKVSREERRIKQDRRGCRSSVGRTVGWLVDANARSRSRAYVCVCARRLGTKLVKLHPHVETWTFHRVYKVPRPPVHRPCFTFLLNDSSLAR